jgi:hypothetical protein
MSSYFYQAYARARDNVILWLIDQSVIAINGQSLISTHQLVNMLVHPQANDTR